MANQGYDVVVDVDAEVSITFPSRGNVALLLAETSFRYDLKI